MPNVIVVGRSSLEMCDAISDVVTRLGGKPEKAVITYSPELCCIDMTERHRDSPYLIVRDTDSVEGLTIAMALNEELNIDVELEIIDAFLPRREGGIGG